MGLNMARTRDSFTGSAGDATLVDKTLGRSYDVVKAVYKKLPELEELQQNQNINKLVENFDKVEEVLQSTDSIINISTNLSEILAAKTYSQQAQVYSKNAANAANSANTAIERVNTILDEAIAVKDDLENYKADLDTVATNIRAVQTTSANIAQINNLSNILSNDLTIPKLDAVLNDLADIITVSDNIRAVTMVANKFIGSGELDKIEAANEEIKNNLVKYKQILENIRQEVVNATLSVDLIQDSIKEGINRVTTEADLRKVELNSTLQECKDLLEQVDKANDIVSDNVDEANTILLKIRSIYHSYEEALKVINDKAMRAIQQASDYECLRIRKEGELQIGRLNDFMEVAIEEALKDFDAKAEEIKLAKLAELEKKANEIIAAIDKKLEEVKFDLTELTNRVDVLEQKVTQLEQMSPDKGDIRFGYVDYSLPNNQANMTVGTTYINAYDEDGNYIQINPDTNAFAKDPHTLKFWIKSLSGNVTFVQKQVQLDLSAYLKKEDLKRATIDVEGILELATTEEVVQGTNALNAVTPYTLKLGLADILINQFEQNPNGLTNTIVQQIVKTIAGDVHLQEDLADSIKDELEKSLSLDQIKDHVTFEQGITVKGDAIFEGNVTVPSQKEEDSANWPNNSVLNKEDILKLLLKNKSTHIEVLANYPLAGTVLEDDILYSVPITKPALELEVMGSEPAGDIRDNFIVGFNTRDILDI